MNSRNATLFALALLCICALSVGCKKTFVRLDVNPKEVSGAGLIDVKWETSGYEQTTLTSNPLLPGLPKTVTGRQSSTTDKFHINQTTTFEIKGQTAGQYGTPATEIINATVTVTPVQPIL